MTDAAGLPPRNLQQFPSMHKFYQMYTLDTLQQNIAREHEHPCSIGIFYETEHPKKGKKTPGAKHQYFANVGKKDNCVVTVNLNYTTGYFHSLLEGDFFLPKSCAEAPRRCQSAGM